MEKMVPADGVPQANSDVLCLLHVSGVDSHSHSLVLPSPSSSLSPCSEARVSQFIRQFVPSCLLVSDSNTELSYVLPSEAVRKGSFQRLFQVSVRLLSTCCPSPSSSDALCSSWMSSKALEDSLDGLALTSFGVMDTTLEEVFLKVSEEDQSVENSDAGEAPPLLLLLLLLQLLSSQLTCLRLCFLDTFDRFPRRKQGGEVLSGLPGGG